MFQSLFRCSDTAIGVPLGVSFPGFIEQCILITCNYFLQVAQGYHDIICHCPSLFSLLYLLYHEDLVAIIKLTFLWIVLHKVYQDKDTT